MNPAVLRALEFDRIREALASLALTPLGRARALELVPATDPAEVQFALDLTTEAALFVRGGGSLGIFASDDLEMILAGVGIADRPLDPLQLLALARFLESVDRVAQRIRASNETRAAGTRAGLLVDVVAGAASFSEEV